MTTSDGVLARLTVRLRLGPAQHRRFFPRMAVLLRPEQKSAFDQYVREQPLSALRPANGDRIYSVAPVRLPSQPDG